MFLAMFLCLNSWVQLILWQERHHKNKLKLFSLTLWFASIRSIRKHWTQIMTVANSWTVAASSFVTLAIICQRRDQSRVVKVMMSPKVQQSTTTERSVKFSKHAHFHSDTNKPWDLSCSSYMSALRLESHPVLSMTDWNPMTFLKWLSKPAVWSVSNFIFFTKLLGFFCQSEREILRVQILFFWNIFFAVCCLHSPWVRWGCGLRKAEGGKKLMTSSSSNWTNVHSVKAVPQDSGRTSASHWKPVRAGVMNFDCQYKTTQGLHTHTRKLMHKRSVASNQNDMWKTSCHSIQLSWCGNPWRNHLFTWTFAPTVHG